MPSRPAMRCGRWREKTIGTRKANGPRSSYCAVPTPHPLETPPRSISPSRGMHEPSARCRTTALSGAGRRLRANRRCRPSCAKLHLGCCPPFIVSLLPEGWLQSVLKTDRDERALLRSGKRYMSNITIAQNAAELARMPADTQITSLAEYAKEGVFTGHYAGPEFIDITADFERRLVALFASSDTPRLSGVQMKAPMHLAADGTLLHSEHLPFTHILKPAGTGAFEALPMVEWTGLEMARAVGLPTLQTALIVMPNGLPPALLIERFDIRNGPADSRLLAMEDLCSVLALSPQEKYTGSIERVARALRALSSDPEADLLMLLRRALFAWLIADGDMHLKYMALLKTAQAGEANFRSVRLAPVYDSLTTRVFPGPAHDRMALKLNGKDERLRRADFVAMATLAGLRAGDANNAMDEILQKLTTAMDLLHVPHACKQSDATAAMTAKALEICRSRISTFA
jgi:serine/threonine-protein kinase HipA